MGKLVVLELDGLLERQDLQVRMKVGVEGETPSAGETGTLPANPKLVACLHHWQQSYRSLELMHRIVPKRVSYGRSPHQFIEIQNLATKLLDYMERWLESKSFRTVEIKLRTVLDPSESIRILIQTKSILLRQLPWHSWAFLRDYSQAEIAFAAPRFQPVEFERLIAKEKVQILAILGHGKGINIQQDRQFLKQIPQAEVVFLVEPKRQDINDYLWERSWDILFFAGHSKTKGDRGQIYCNPQESISLDNFEYGLRRAIASGLQIAIFNSCDGLGLAQTLEKLQFPQLIVMREPVPDQVAQIFLKQLLQSFTTGQSLYQSVRQARERLQGVENCFPCASWLPILCQNPAVIPPTWEALVKRRIQTDPTDQTGVEGQSEARARNLLEVKDLSHNTRTQQPETRYLPDTLTSTLSDNLTRPGQLRLRPDQQIRYWQAQLRQIRFSLLISFITLLLILGIRHQGWLQSVELKAFDHMMQVRPEEGVDPRLLIVEVTDTDIEMQQQNQELLQRQSTSAQTFNQLFDTSLSDDSLNRLLKALAPARGIGLDIYRDFPVELDHLELATRLQKMPQLIAICKAEDFQDADIPSIDSPPEVPLDRVGFSDFVADNDGILRRHLLGMLPPLQTPDSQCNINTSFSVQIAFHFLHQQGIVAQFTPAGNLQLGEKVYKRLRSRSGSYAGIASSGSQLLLNYRSTTAIAPRLTLTQILQNKVNPKYLQNKVVLIGVTASGGDDNWSTPYGVKAENQMPGVIVQAHMVSQLLSAALDQRPLLQSWTECQEAGWISIWAIAGSILAWRWGRRVLRWIGAIAIASGLLYLLCFSALLKGWWIPFVPSWFVLVLVSSVMSYGRWRSPQPPVMQPQDSHKN